MYLKSLVLKGFKSFADRSVLNLEPGVTAVVGPNGSGKSNISDAVLWVLGERNAKNLRGQVMGDVIFAGSSKRRSVNVAEVTLVLDNSDGALPVEYDEVSITRRMYRNGESEYLINGTLARRMDILDILHDSGLGAGTHSIISQGHLDSILQSKPEDRRALIEEAAGVLKHKQRKAKSQRKLEQMDLHLARVNDVVSEVQRQLGPLERKAKRALAYKDVSAELADLSLKLAVDDLRTLQTEYRECEHTEQTLLAKLEEARSGIERAEEQAEALQARIAQDSDDAMAVVRRSSSMASCVQRLDSNLLLLKQRAQTARSRADEATALQTAVQDKLAVQAAELEEAVQQLESLQAECESAQEYCDAAQHAFDQHREMSRTLLQRAAQSEEARLALAAQLEQLTVQLTRQREHLAADSGKAAALEARIAELASQREALIQQLAGMTVRRDELASRLEADRQRAEEASKRVEEARAAYDRAQEEHALAREREQVLAAELRGIEELERTLGSASGPAYGWVASQEGGAFGSPVPLSRFIRAPHELEALVERLLADDVASLLVDDSERVRALDAALAKRGEAGSVTLVMRDDACMQAVSARDAKIPQGAFVLVDRIGFDDQAKRVIEALLGDVVVCRDAADALALHKESALPLRYATQDGFVVFPSGKVLLGMPSQDPKEGVLERGRRYSEAKRLLAEARAAGKRAFEKMGQCDERLAAARTESLAAEQAMAQSHGILSAARTDVLAAKDKLSAAESDLASARKELERANDSLGDSKPRVEELLRSSASAETHLKEAAAQAASAQEALEPARVRDQELSAELSEARLRVATLSERLRHAGQTRESLARRCNESRSDADRNRVIAMKQQLLSLRIAPIVEALAEVARRARERHAQLEQSVSAAQESSRQLSERQAQVRLLSRQAHDGYDEVNTRLSDVRVEKGRLELRVQNAVDQIVHECATSVEAALKLPLLENREEVELTATRLRNRIAKMGTINPDAAAEYEQLKERYDYLAAQLADLAAARSSLAKIDRVIEARMKDDFAMTFVKVNENFQRIFATLFPGGQAHLALEDPDNMDATGVEVAAQPHGKRVMKMSLMSGGEKSLVALALLFAVYKIRSAPFYILDEVEAALDDTNLRRLIAYLEGERASTQLIMITHQRRTMETADVLFGVSMQSDGISKVISQRLDHALRYAE